jgi:uncharacterized protein
VLLFTGEPPLCAGCGACCRLVVELKPGRDQIPPELTVQRDGARFMDQHGDGTCVALDRLTRLCTIYDQRPETCRKFARGSERCRQVLFARR